VSKGPRYHLTSRIAKGGAILGGVALAVGLFVVAPIADRSSSDDSPSSIAAIMLIFLGSVTIVLSAALYVADALWRRGRGRAERERTHGRRRT
jgi:formate hydrogenlyase subunit 3/multisubunit Na+/H+ antiporter MnhD subunit